VVERSKEKGKINHRILEEIQRRVREVNTDNV
jgi:hypothetical protein